MVHYLLSLLTPRKTTIQEQSTIQELIRKEMYQSDILYLEPYLYIATKHGVLVGILSKGKYRRILIHRKEVWERKIPEVGGMVLTDTHPLSWWQEVLHHIQKYRYPQNFSE